MHWDDWQQPPICHSVGCARGNATELGWLGCVSPCAQDAWLNPPVCSDYKRSQWSVGSGSGAQSNSTASQSWLQPPIASVGSLRASTETKRKHLRPDAEESVEAKKARSSLKATDWDDWLQPDVSAKHRRQGVNQKPQVVDVHLTLGNVFLASLRPGGQLNQYEQKARKESENAQRLSKPCCKCRCGMHINFQDLLAFNSCFYALTAEERGAVIRQSYWESQASDREGESPDKAVARWHFLGSQVCVPRLCQLLQCAPNTLYGTYLEGKPDGRKWNCPAGDPSVDLFCLEVYNSAAETLPEEDHICGVDQTINADEIGVAEKPAVSGQWSAGSAARLLPLVSWDPSADLQEQLRMLGADAVSQLPPRYLQHQRLSDLWWQYVASSRPGAKTVSYRHFTRIWRHRWANALKMRKTSQHAQCTECWQYSNYIHQARGDQASRQAAAANWHKHIQETKHNRQIYWKARWMSRKRNGDVLAIIIDSMDKAKCAWPQYTFRKNKELEALALKGGNRPKLVINAAMAHGYCTDFYIAEDEDMFHGGSDMQVDRKSVV